ncbi:YcaO-like family protein [Paenibacillus sp. KACC 21273]|uniref:YcaO-like family protein n=1 Tax=Paenibacillus sp. KACC 21273 TaxID=3025665 RepID=UPI0023672542|nr:YcaO-like family protein [Paenibacillus sp. KACC 21273]WDF49011.1 YcaO-like family protein [Paenibacillus sp. KACC 21273]
MSLIIYGQHIEELIEQCINKVNHLLMVEELKSALNVEMILLQDHIYISNSQNYINEKMNQKSKRNAMYNYYHQSTEDIYKHIYYYFVHQERYSFISIDSCCIQMEIKYPIRENELKNHSSYKRLDSQVRMDELKYYLMEYKAGYIIKTDGNNISIMNREYSLIEGFGYEFDKNMALKKALFEYLERCMASYELKGKIVDTYNNLKSQAINPEVFGLYNKKNRKLASYEPDLILEWIEAKSLINNHSIYIPEQWAQYLKKDILNQYVYDSSNGSAIGNTYKEASLFSILEAIERDLFMQNWFYTHNFKRIEFDSAKEMFLQGAELYFQQLGYDLEFYYMENAMSIPAVWCLIRSNDVQNNLYSITGLGCHLHIAHAIKAAFFEAYKAFEDLINQDQVKLLAEIQRVEKIKEIDKVMDHLYYFLSYESKMVIEKKLKGIESIYYSKLLSNSYEHIDIEEELKNLLNKASTCYEDILIVDQTNDFLEKFSLHCTKAILIGSIPLDFTTHFIRPYHNVSDEKIKQKNIHPLA